MNDQPASLVEYYRKNHFNPVPISLATPEALAMHNAKRYNLYTAHLGIPLGLLNGQKVLEFGCNSGENSVILARYGADLTLVEPNEQVHERLRDVFAAFDLSKRLSGIFNAAIEDFPEEKKYNLVLAEGFLFTLPNKAEMAAKICRLLAPNGIGVISFNCRIGGLIELHKRLVLYRACELAGVDFCSEESLELARKLFEPSFERIRPTRPFASWWKDLLVNPFYADRYLWSYGELLPIIEAAGATFLSTSPRWFAEEAMRWYKNVPERGERHQMVMDQWRRNFGGMLTGRPLSPGGHGEANQEIVSAVESLALGISDYTEGKGRLEDVYPSAPLIAWFSQATDSHLASLGVCIQKVGAALRDSDARTLCAAIASSGLADLWGSAYHYLSFIRDDQGK